MKNASRVARYMMLRPDNRQEENRRTQERGGEREQPRQQKRSEEYRYEEYPRNRYSDERYVGEYRADRYRSEERRPEGPRPEQRRDSGYRQEDENRRPERWPERISEREEPEDRRRSRYSGEDGRSNDSGERRRMTYIGFGDREQDGDEPPWRTSGNEGDEMTRRKGERTQGGIRSDEMQLTEDTADEWVQTMRNADGSTGPHWNMEQARQLAQRRGVKAAPAEFYAILNAVYSDYCEVAKKHNVHNADFYADLAKAWLSDKDAVPDKASAYYKHVVQHKSN